MSGQDCAASPSVRADGVQRSGGSPGECDTRLAARPGQIFGGEFPDESRCAVEDDVEFALWWSHGVKPYPPIPAQRQTRAMGRRIPHPNCTAQTSESTPPSRTFDS